MARNNRNSRNRNPNNSSSKLFRQLTRLLSGPVANFRQQNPRRLKRRQLANFDFKSASIKQEILFVKYKDIKNEIRYMMFKWEKEQQSNCEIHNFERKPEDVDKMQKMLDKKEERKDKRLSSIGFKTLACGARKSGSIPLRRTPRWTINL